MTAQMINIQLPEEVYRRLRETATLTEQPLEAIILHSIQGNLPPMLNDLQPDTRRLVADLDRLDDDAVWRIAHQALPRRSWQRHQVLLDKLQAHPLTSDEAAELGQLRHAVDQAILRRSYALALLKWRGYSLPLLPNP